ncbi:hypothetical protein Kpol_1014p10 [Vanderwaltozyma polyspora DSM 70294]|uniref:Ammonia transport outward protein 2 n=1 Tax=Vanderwaltozyma polyspora (strain ATCC 22028 / DSM 70294 / BCRC 21397 / CBS 2163 / NBRC 10782 / NRRL Y-8283 / UCD 57-17) TaxID=436907 RepID=A7TND9_VANPO|nr:uncharacterized protein Kpol_1014p10 [Vanderwaltozyma polyspora DSM 70294]EDO16192.1 hypothetical protein Kpol_1014p10 [Vanderwaltozyma polyspora DSM 70294]
MSEVSSTNTDLENNPITYNGDGTETGRYNDSAPSKSVSTDSLGQVYTAGENDEYIFIGRQKFLRSDLYEAFGGTLNPGLAPAPVHRFANPAPLGLSAFALSTFVLSMYNAGAQGIVVPNLIVGLAMFYGGLMQTIAGIWEIALENTFGGTTLCSYGAFWLSFGAIYIPWFGILEAYTAKPSDLNNALGFYLLGWAIFTLGVVICTMKSTVLFFGLFFMLFMTFLLLCIASFSGRHSVQVAGGVFGVITAFIAWYNAYAGLATRQNSYILAHPFPLPSNEKVII